MFLKKTYLLTRGTMALSGNITMRFFFRTASWITFDISFVVLLNESIPYSLYLADAPSRFCRRPQSERNGTNTTLLRERKFGNRIRTKDLKGIRSVNYKWKAWNMNERHRSLLRLKFPLLISLLAVDEKERWAHYRVRLIAQVSSLFTVGLPRDRSQNWICIKNWIFFL